MLFHLLLTITLYKVDTVLSFLSILYLVNNFMSTLHFTIVLQIGK